MILGAAEQALRDVKETSAADEVEANATYDQVLRALRETAKGQWFLEEFSRRNRAADTLTVLESIEGLKAGIANHHEEGRINVLRAELQDMAAAIAKTRDEIASIRSDDAASDQIATATGELEAIVSSTEQATSDILAAAESLLEIAGRLGEGASESETAEKIEGLATEILMACSFQDLTGQRTTKVVNALRYIEQRVNTMIDIWGIPESSGSRPEAGKDPFDQRPDRDLMSGPAAIGTGVSQQDVDAMLAGDIDALSDHGGDAPLEPDQSKQDPKTMAIEPAETESSGSINQSEIDSLFD